MNRITTCALALCVIAGMSSCATVLTGTTQKVRIVTDPPGATVEVNGVSRGVTPADVPLKKGFKGETVALKKEGYSPLSIQPAVAFNPVAVLNLLGMLGWAVDGATGAMMKYAPKSYEVTLKKP